MEPAVPDPQSEIARVQQELGKLMDEASELGAASPGALVPTTSTSPETAKASMAQLHSEVARVSSEMAVKQRELQRLLDEQLARTREALEPLKKLTKRLQEGIWTVNLYFGRDEDITIVQEGEPASPDTPVVVRQLVLNMDEESALFAEKGGMDVDNLDDFDEWIRQDPAHLDQLIPEQKGVVALRVRGEAKDYDNPWEAISKDAENHGQTHFLIRNGQQVFLTTTDFDAGKYLVPLSKEFTSFFEQKIPFGESRPLTPGTREWAQAEEQADARRRHYMRVALILQGLIDRTSVLNPVPQGFNFLDYECYDKGWVSIITDADNTLVSGRLPFRKWQYELNSQLRPGMRLIGVFNTYAVGKVLEESYDRRIHPKNASRPESLVPYTIEETSKNGDLVIRYARTDEVYDATMWRDNPDKPGWGWRGGYKIPKTRARAELRPTDDFIIAYDLATIEDMEAYLRSRTDRHEYATMFPVLKAAIAAKKAEAEQEQPFRQLLTGLLAKENNVTIEEASESVDTLITWWKFKNKTHRALIGTDDSKAIKDIVSEHHKLLAAQTHDIDVTKLRQEFPDALLIATKKDGAVVIYTPQNEDKVFVTEHTIKGSKRSTKEWVWPMRRHLSWSQLYTAKAWDEWDLNADKNAHLSDPELDFLVEQLKTQYSDKYLLGIEFGKTEYELLTPCFRVWWGTNLDASNEVKINHRPEGPDTKATPVPWHRSAGSRPVLDEPRRDHTYIGCTLLHNESKYKILYRDAKNCTAMLSLLAKHDKAERQWSNLRDEQRRLVNKVHGGWLDEVLTQRKARFMEDYKDDTLWQSQAAKIKNKLSWSWTSGPYLDRLCDDIVDNGMTVEGLTVREVATSLGRDDAPEEIADLTF